MKKIIFTIIILLCCFNVINIKAITVNEEYRLFDEYQGGSTEDIYQDGYVSETDSDDDFNCKTIFLKSNGQPTEFKKLLDGIFGIMQILAPVIAIVLTIIDYIKSLSTVDTKKVNIRTIKRIVIAVLIVFLPLLLDLLFHLFGLYDLSTCGVGR